MPDKECLHVSASMCVRVCMFFSPFNFKFDLRTDDDRHAEDNFLLNN